VVPTVSPNLHTSLVVNKETTGMEGLITDRDALSTFSSLDTREQLSKLRSVKKYYNM